MRKIGETGNRMRISAINGGIIERFVMGESEHVARSQSVGRVEVRSDHYTS